MRSSRAKQPPSVGGWSTIRPPGRQCGARVLLGATAPARARRMSGAPEVDALTRALCDPARLAPWLDAQGLAPGAPLVVERITTGHSNETFRVRRGSAEWILRRPPRVPLAPTAHDMVREARLLRALGGT